MPSAHDVCVLHFHIEPDAIIVCAMCGEKLIAEQGKSQLCSVKLADEDEYHDRWIIFCGELCAWLARRERTPDA